MRLRVCFLAIIFLVLGMSTVQAQKTWDCTAEIAEPPWSGGLECGHYSCGEIPVLSLQFGGGIFPGVLLDFDLEGPGSMKIETDDGKTFDFPLDAGAYQISSDNINADFFGNALSGPRGILLSWVVCGESNIRAEFFNQEPEAQRSRLSQEWLCPTPQSDSEEVLPTCYSFPVVPGSFIRAMFWNPDLTKLQTVWVEGYGDIVVGNGVKFQTFKPHIPQRLCIAGGGPYTHLTSSDVCLLSSFEQVQPETRERFSVSPEPTP